MSERHFIMAKLALPIEVENGTDFKLYREKITIEFDHCRDLPDNTSKSDLDVIYRIFPSMRPNSDPVETNQDDVPEYKDDSKVVDVKPIMVQLNRSKGYPKAKNRMTFKRYPKTQRFTRRQYSKESNNPSD
jgi:hypothetical protein